MSKILSFPRKKAPRPTRKSVTSIRGRRAEKRQKELDLSAISSSLTLLSEIQTSPEEAVHLVEQIDCGQIATELDPAVKWLIRFAEEWRHHADRKEKASLAAEGKHLRAVE